PPNTLGSDCPLAGPDFPAARELSGSLLLDRAIATFESVLSNETLRLRANDTAFGVALFSSTENKMRYESYHTPPINVGVPAVDRNSIFRIGSISKLFTVWTFLVNARGDSLFNEPVTKYVPELAGLLGEVGGDVVYGDINQVNWEEVTLGNLASQAAGIPRDAILGAFSTLPAGQLAQLGIPPVKESERPTCGTNETAPPCDREQTFGHLLKQYPIFATSHSPAYSNIAYTILAYALEKITGEDMESLMTETIVQLLGLGHSSYSKVPSSGGVIPGDLTQSGWAWDIGADNPAGSIYMSTGDMITASQAML
ncbi:beta-lactamase/transpeptidase-like protein, partial [Thozetella sp. PMI_491]